MKFKKLLCTAFLALSWCATSAAAYNEDDIVCAKNMALSMTPVRGVPNGTLAARIQYYTQTRNHLHEVLKMDFEAYKRSPDFPYYVSAIPVLNRYYTSGDLNARNFQTVVREAIELFDYLIAQTPQTPQIAPN